MVFIESAVFTRQLRGLLTDEEYTSLQWHLALYPSAGKVIQDTGGLRKVRWASGTGGKRGGVRLSYFHAVSEKLLIYRKGVKDDLSAAEKKGSSRAQQELVGVSMNKKLFSELVESMTQMDEIVRGKRAPSRKFQVDAIAIKALRAKIGLSQPKFAALLNVDVGTLRNWEQGRREPTGPAKALLTAISRDPKNVLKALAA
jgi:putative transcriptional regulator